MENRLINQTDLIRRDSCFIDGYLKGDCCVLLKVDLLQFFFNVDVVIDEELFDETDLADIEAEINELELEA